MADEQKPKPRFWPMLFIGAFGLGAILWCVWMVGIVIVQNHKQIQRDELYPAVPKSSLGASSNRPPMATNGSVSTNSAAADTK